MIYRISHTTIYDYSEPVTLCHNLARLTPRDSPRQSCRSSELRIAPAPDVQILQTDYFGNPATFFTLQKAHHKLTITALHEAEVGPFAAPAPAGTASWEAVRERLQSDRDPEWLDAYQFTFDSPYCQADAELAEYAAPSFGEGQPILEAVLDLTGRIHEEFTYDREATTVATPLGEVLAGRRGVCQDFAHLEIACLRSLGLAARYVSGYLLTNPPPGRQRLVGGDASHAWLSVFCGDAGWVDVDPTNNQIPSDQHIVLAWGRDYGDVSPIKGVILGGRHHTVSVAVDVVRSEQATGD
jgi:transglutaminase-like putative cysteine protease